MDTARATGHTPHADTLDPGIIDAIIRGEHGAPFDVLGPHQINVGSSRSCAIRTFLPGARAAWVIPIPDSGATSAPGPNTHTPDRITMQRVHAEGFFTAILEDLAPCHRYLLEVQLRDGSHRRLRDPYSFGPVLSDYDLHLLGEGRHHQAYERLGAHPREHEGMTGVAFAVWAPNARRVSLVGDFNSWDERALPMRLRSGGLWELFVPDLPAGATYKYAMLSWSAGYRVLKADPFAFAAELRPGTASRVWDLEGYAWSDHEWMAERARRDPLTSPMTTYELHVGSWRPDAGSEADPVVTYRGLAHQLVPYLQELGYTHVELMPIAEHPFDGSWGYQVTGYFAPTSRYGTPQDFMYFVDYCHQHGIGVLLDWVPAHFPRDEHGLAYFDGSHLYEHADPRQGEHPDWGTLVFNFGRNEVRNFLLSNALFWLDKYHIDGLRVDAVASMLYLDYSRRPGQWLPNEYGGRENLEAIAFLREFNELVHGEQPGVVTVAEESTAWPLVSRPTYLGGLGFTFKWNMGWMHDVLHYFARDPVFRRYHHNELTFSLMYAFSENFILPFSHDEVVHLKGSMLTKMPGDVWQKFANLRALYAYMYGHPGKKLLFMGSEFGQWAEWNYASWLTWFLLGPAGDRPSLHTQLHSLVRDLNLLLRRSPALYAVDFEPAGFEWIDANDADNSTLSFMRRSADGRDLLVFVCNFTPMPHYGYRVGVPEAGQYAEILNTDAAVYGGSNVGNLGQVMSEPTPMHGRPNAVSLTLPPLATIILRLIRPDTAVGSEVDAREASIPGAAREPASGAATGTALDAGGPAEPSQTRPTEPAVRPAKRPQRTPERTSARAHLQSHPRSTGPPGPKVPTVPEPEPEPEPVPEPVPGWHSCVPILTLVSLAWLACCHPAWPPGSAPG